MRYSIKVILIWILVIQISCRNSSFLYPQKENITDEGGLPNDSLGSYFSSFESVDSTQYEFLKNSFLQNYFTTALYIFKEPVLYNKYLGKERFRFLWLPSFHKPMLYTISKDASGIVLNTRKLDRQPLTHDFSYSNSEWDQDYLQTGHEIIKEVDTLENDKVDTITKIKGRFAKIEYETTQRLSNSQWKQFKNLLTKAEYWDLPVFKSSGATDGAFWLIEANTKEHYKYVVRNMPDQNVMKIGQFLADLSGFKIELY
ncbi:MAG: hypothetical protein ABI688_00965 [Bacteroidota bacterium]